MPFWWTSDRALLEMNRQLLVGNRQLLEDIAEDVTSTRLIGLATQRKIGDLMAHLERLTAAVTAVNNKADSLITLVNGLAEKIRELKGDEAALDALATELETKASEIQTAVDANTEPEQPE